MEAIPFKYIPPSTLDVFLMNSYTFLLIKQALYKRNSKTQDELWENVVEEWNKMYQNIFKKSLLTWRSRHNIIVEENGYQM